MNYLQVTDQLKTRQYQPVYLLEGEETYYIDELANFFEDKILSPSEKSFNLTVFYGRDADAGTVINAAKRYPMGSPFQIVLLKEAQTMAKLDGLLPYIERPVPSTLFIICYKYGKIDRRTQFGKSLLKNSVHLESKKLYDDKVPGWIVDYTTSIGYTISLRSAQTLADYLGNDLGKISGQIDKLTLGLTPGAVIESDCIEQNIGISREYNVFEFGQVLASKHYKKIYKMVFFFCANPKDHPLVVITGYLGSFFAKVLSYHYLVGSDRGLVAGKLGVNPYFLSTYETASKNFPLASLQTILSAIRRADVQSKGVDIGPNTPPGDILKELIYTILHA